MASAQESLRLAGLLAKNREKGTEKVEKRGENEARRVTLYSRWNRIIRINPLCDHVP